MFKKCSSLVCYYVKLKHNYFCLLILLEVSQVLKTSHKTQAPNFCDRNKQNTAEFRATGGMKCYSCLVGKTSAEESCAVSMHKKHQWIFPL